MMTDPRSVIRISGADARSFLQGLITNDIEKADSGLVYAALLTPQGKYLADFFVVADGDGYLLDVSKDLAASLVQRLSMYKLRADVSIDATPLIVSRGLDEPVKDAYRDPRHPALGWRAIGATESGDEDAIDWTGLRVANGIPQSMIELVPNECYPLEMGFEALNGLDFRKGCYVGQEVTARMKHKTELRKGLAQVDIDGSAPVGSDITAAGKPVGTLYSQSDGRALAYLRFDRAKGEMSAGSATVRLKS